MTVRSREDEEESKGERQRERKESRGVQVCEVEVWMRYGKIARACKMQYRRGICEGEGWMSDGMKE